MCEPPDFFSDLPEIEYCSRLIRSKRIDLGQVFTPYPIARCMARWICSGRQPAKILDPAFGLGIFHRAVIEVQGSISSNLVGYETDLPVIQAAQSWYDGAGYAQPEIRNQDFLSASWEEQFDAVLCNPPYQKFRGRTDTSRLVEIVRNHTGILLRRASNLYVFFLLKAAWQLAEGGRAAFILPYEFLNADYGKTVKQGLINQGLLRNILIFAEEFQPFDQVLTTTCILLLERTPFAGMPRILTIHSIEELDRWIGEAGGIGNEPDSMTPLSSVVPDPLDKWHSPLILVKKHEVGQLVPLSTFGRFMRGIATGDNEYFVINEEMRQNLGLSLEMVKPCLAKSAFAPGGVFAGEDFHRLTQAGKPVWLVCMEGNEGDPYVQNYLQLGISRGTNLRYLPKHRSPWYAVEKRPSAPLLTTTFHRGELRWVRNLAGVSNLTAFHGFYPRFGTDVDLLSAWLITPYAKKLAAQNRRAYGNGLHKFEPNDLNQALVMDLRQLKEKDRQTITEIYFELSRSDQQEVRGNLVSNIEKIFSALVDT